ncbi:plasmid mobilization protein [Planctellipticum variicoloris]|uniref:plasmid mobilization protein n=1 Tax=Planctellipticum variicoloris TaxID=3064265 RepID=UPI0030132789|nr:hypothetical protein SH412_000948 [Planctomycetaceae bacterium SH412]
MAGERKTAVLQIRMTEDEKAKLDAAAAAAGQPTGTWLRDMGLAAADDIAGGTKKRKKSGS